jgi:hypothetical protein
MLLRSVVGRSAPQCGDGAYGSRLRLWIAANSLEIKCGRGSRSGSDTRTSSGSEALRGFSSSSSPNQMTATTASRRRCAAEWLCREAIGADKTFLIEPRAGNVEPALWDHAAVPAPISGVSHQMRGALSQRGRRSSAGAAGWQGLHGHGAPRNDFTARLRNL